MKDHIKKQLVVGTGLLAAGGVAVWLQVGAGSEPMPAFVRALIPVAALATYLGKKIEDEAKAKDEARARDEARAASEEPRAKKRPRNNKKRARDGANEGGGETEAPDRT